MNPLFKALGGGAMPSMPGPLVNFQQMVRKFQISIHAPLAGCDSKNVQRKLHFF